MSMMNIMFINLGFDFAIKVFITENLVFDFLLVIGRA
jgi:hypothetical protein